MCALVREEYGGGAREEYGDGGGDALDGMIDMRHGNSLHISTFGRSFLLGVASNGQKTFFGQDKRVGAGQVEGRQFCHINSGRAASLVCSMLIPGCL